MSDLSFLPYVAVIFINSFTLLLVSSLFSSIKKRDEKSWLFVFVSLYMLLRVDSFFASEILTTSSYFSHFLNRTSWVALIFIYYCLFLFSVSVSKINGRAHIFKLLYLALSILASILVFFSYYLIAVVILLLLLTLSSIYMQLVSRGENKNTLILAFSLFFMFHFGLIVLLPTYFLVDEFIFLGDYLSLVILGLSSYAIFHKDMFDINVVVSEIIALSMTSLLGARIFANATYVDPYLDMILFSLSLVFSIILIRTMRAESQSKKELEVLNKKLSEMDSRKNEFISVAAHELRAPLTAVKGYLSMLLEGDGGELPIDAQGYVQDTLVPTERMIRLVNNLLNVASIEENRMVFQIEKVHLRELVENVYNQFKTEASRRELSFDLIVDENLSDLVLVDRDRLPEVIINYLSNALKYTEIGGVSVKLINPNPNTVRVEVIDTGPGISLQEQERLFQKFYRAQGTAGRTIGTGLGLYICKLLVNRFGGQIGVISDTGKGSNFWFELPVIS